MGKTGKFDYNFKLITNDKYSLVMTLATSGELMNKIFNMSKKQLHKKYGIKNIKGDPQQLTKFKVPISYYKALRTITRKLVRMCYKEFKGDKIELVNHEVTGAEFERVVDVWKITINYEGLYIDKR